jgi:hypothetical protein
MASIFFGDVRAMAGIWCLSFGLSLHGIPNAREVAEWVGISAHKMQQLISKLRSPRIS